MANPQLSAALPEVGGIRVYYTPYDSGQNYPMAAPGPTPCMAVVADGSFLYYCYLYLDYGGGIQAHQMAFSGGS